MRHEKPEAVTAVDLDLDRLGSALAYRETGDPFAGEIGHSSPHAGALDPAAGRSLADFLLSLGAALRMVAEVRGLRSVGR